jgi:hypothetical protein
MRKNEALSATGKVVCSRDSMWMKAFPRTEGLFVLAQSGEVGTTPFAGNFLRLLQDIMKSMF